MIKNKLEYYQLLFNVCVKGFKIKCIKMEKYDSFLMRVYQRVLASSHLNLGSFVL